jgi:hypothetical protein
MSLTRKQNKMFEADDLAISTNVYLAATFCFSQREFSANTSAQQPNRPFLPSKHIQDKKFWVSQ